MVWPIWRMPRAKISRSSGISLRAAMAENNLQTDLSCQPFLLARGCTAVLSRASRVKISAGFLTRPSFQKALICFSPRPSISKASRLTNWLRRSTAWAGQISQPVQRVAASPLSRTTIEPHSGQVFGNVNSSELAGRFPRITCTTCGITSPARCTIT